MTFRSGLKYGDVIFNYLGLFDKMGNPIINITDTNHNWNSIVPNPRYKSHSPERNYYLIEGGTSASISILQIFNSNSVEIERINAVSEIPKEGYNWNFNNELIYYQLDENNLGGGFCNVRKMIWKNGITTETNEFVNTYIE